MEKRLQEAINELSGEYIDNSLDGMIMDVGICKSQHRDIFSKSRGFNFNGMGQKSVDFDNFDYRLDTRFNRMKIRRLLEWILNYGDLYCQSIPENVKRDMGMQLNDHIDLLANIFIVFGQIKITREQRADPRPEANWPRFCAKRILSMIRKAYDVNLQERDRQMASPDTPLNDEGKELEEIDEKEHLDQSIGETTECSSDERPKGPIEIKLDLELYPGSIISVERIKYVLKYACWKITRVMGKNSVVSKYQYTDAGIQRAFAFDNPNWAHPMYRLINALIDFENNTFIEMAIGLRQSEKLLKHGGILNLSMENHYQSSVFSHFAHSRKMIIPVGPDDRHSRQTHSKTMESDSNVNENDENEQLVESIDQGDDNENGGMDIHSKELKECSDADSKKLNECADTDSNESNECRLWTYSRHNLWWIKLNEPVEDICEQMMGNGLKCIANGRIKWSEWPMISGHVSSSED